MLLSLLIHDRLHGWTGSFCPEQNHTAKPNFMLSIYHFDDSGPDRNIYYVASLNLQANIAKITAQELSLSFLALCVLFDFIRRRFLCTLMFWKGELISLKGRGGSTGVARKKLCHPTCHPRIITE